MQNFPGRPLVARAARVALIATTALTAAAMHRAHADTLDGALALAYQNNPQINSQRAATNYMNLLRDAALLELQRNNVKVLEATLRQTRDRFTAGEVTRTDLAQAESSLAAGRSSLHAAESNFVTSKSAYVQVVGVEPGKLARASPVDRFSPPPLPAALSRPPPQKPTVTTAIV